jgi:hypothetical protein
MVKPELFNIVFDQDQTEFYAGQVISGMLPLILL